jgi:hypothetical protein
MADEELRRRVTDVTASTDALIAAIRRLRTIDAQRALVPAHELAEALKTASAASLELRREILTQIRQETALSLSQLGQRISMSRGRIDQIINGNPRTRATKGTGEDSNG